MKLGNYIQVLAKVSVLGVVKLLMLAASIAAARLLSPSALAEFFVLTGAIGLGGAISGLGMDQYWLRLFPTYSADGRQQQLMRIALFSISISIVGSAVFLLIMIAIGAVNFPASPLHFVLLVLAIAGGFVRRLSQTVMLLEGKRVASLILGGGLFYVLLIAATFMRDWSVTEMVGFSSIVSGLASAALIYFRLKRIPRGASIHPVDSLFSLVAGAFPSLVNQLGGSILQRGDVLVLAALSTDAELNRYGLAMRLTYALSVVPELLGLLFGREIAGIVHGTAAARRAFILRLWGLSLAACLSIAFGLAVFGRDLISAFYGADYVTAYAPLLILLIGKGASSTFGVSPVFFTATGQSKQVAIGMAGAVTLFLALGLFLAPPFGAKGLAVATSAALLLIALNSIQLFRRIDHDAVRQ